MRRQLPTAEYLHESFIYDPTTGVLTWKERPLHHFQNELVQRRSNGRAGKVAGCIDRRGGRVVIGINGRLFFAHRIIWMLMTGECPHEIDHVDGNPANNKWTNLRASSHLENMWNQKSRLRELPRGVYKSDNGKRFFAKMSFNYRLIYIGTYDTPAAAHAAWRDAVRNERGEFFRAE